MILKSKIYLKPQEKPPEGVRMQRGPKGGLYYETKTKIAPKYEYEYEYDPRDLGKIRENNYYVDTFLSAYRHDEARGQEMWVLDVLFNLPQEDFSVGALRQLFEDTDWEYDFKYYDKLLESWIKTPTRENNAALYEFLKTNKLVRYTSLYDLFLIKGDEIGAKKFGEFITSDKKITIYRGGGIRPDQFLNSFSLSEHVAAQFGEWVGARTNTYMPSVKDLFAYSATGEAEIFIETRKLEDIESKVPLSKSKIYLKPQEKPPEGVRMQRGPRGGMYYEEHISIKKPSKFVSKPIPPVKLDIAYSKDPELLNEPLFANFITDFKEAKNLPKQLEVLSEYKRTFERNLESQLYYKVQKIHRALYRHAKYVLRQHELAKFGKAHIDVKLFQHRIKIFEKVKDTEESLTRVSKVHKSLRIDEGVNDTRKIQFSNDVMINALFKSKKGEYKGIRAGIKTQYNREVCAYDLDQLFKLNLVPETVYKEVEGEIGSAQKWVDGTISPLDMLAENRIDAEISRAKIFDYLTTNTDRHKGNFLFKKNHLVLIDHGCLFSSIDVVESDTFSDVILSEDFDESEIINQFISVPWDDIEKILEKHKIPKKAQEICEQKFRLLKDNKRFPTKFELHLRFPDEGKYRQK